MGSGLLVGVRFQRERLSLLGDTEMPVNQNDVSGIDGICDDLQSPGV